MLFTIPFLKSKVGLVELATWLVMFFCICLPSYGPINQNITCSRENSYLVRRFLRNKWYPILDRYGARLPLECPLHPQREIFWRQEAAKRRHKSVHWTCGFCGKTFQTEQHINSHMERRHDDCLYLSEDAICLADFCDVLRCDVLEAIRKRDLKDPKQEATTDVELWKDNAAFKKALQTIPSRDLTLYTRAKNFEDGKKETSKAPVKCSEMKQNQHNIFILTREKYLPLDKDCNLPSSDCQGCQEKINTTANATDPLLEDEMWAAYRKQRSQCHEEDMAKVKAKCEELVNVCTMGLLLSLSDTDFKDMHAELRRNLCDYLSCSRYWEDVIGGDRRFPWMTAGLVIILLSFGVCLAYYIVWGVTEDEVLSRPIPVIRTEEVEEHHLPEINGRSHSQGRVRKSSRPDEDDRHSSTLPRRSRHHREDHSREKSQEGDLIHMVENKKRPGSDRYSNHGYSSQTQDYSPGSDGYDETLWPVAEEGSDVEDFCSLKTESNR